MEEATVYAGMSETNISALKEALLDQQQLLQKLYSELDVEREASATAASEALSMILRLQGEKAAVEMEASQYKRMAEEKMCYAEHSFSIFKELIYHKEMEIASLEHQAQAYRYKLLSMGWTEMGVHDNRFPGNLCPRRCNLLNVDIGFNQNVRRISSLPAIRWKDAYQKKGIPKSSSGVWTSEANPIIIEECFGSDSNKEIFNVEKKYGNNSTTGDLDSYWEQIRKLDSRVKEISQSKCPHRERYVNSCSISSCMSVPETFSFPSGRENSVSNQIRLNQDYPDNASCCSMQVAQDILEVPQKEARYKTLVKERSKSISKADSETHGCHTKDQTEWINKLFSLNLEAKPARPRDNRKDEVDSVESQSGLQQLSQRMERLVKEGINQWRSEIVREGLGEEELNLLREIRQQLNSIQSEMRCWRRKEEPIPDETTVVTVMEAMLHFWL